MPKNSWNSLGLYASGETEFGKFLINTGLRFDNFWINTEETDGYVDDDDNPLPTEDEHYSSVNGSLGAVYALGSGVNLVTNIGSAYRVPNVVERFYFGSASNRETRPNPDIKPERSISLDFGVKAVHDEVNYSLIGFYSDYSDFTQLQNFDSIPAPGPPGAYTPLWRYENIDDVTIYGFEGVVEANFHSGVYGSLSFTYQHGQNDTEDEPLFVSPVKTSATAGYRHKKHGLFGEVTVRKIEDQGRVPNVTYLDDIATKGFAVVDVTAGVTLFSSVKLAVVGKNLFDEVYAEPFNARNPDNPVPEAGRGLVVSINAGI
ncbi:MAG: TonB-dependent receptor [candidate division Zixibacteria bacterium]|nr:TonB-dependent receptor [candidate division Zixibacteria bacterium]